MAPIALSALVALLVFGDLELAKVPRPSPPPTFQLVARKIATPPPISLAVKRPDGTVWRQTWPALKPDVPVDMSAWHVGPGSYHFTLDVGGLRKTFLQALARPVLKSELEIVWDGIAWPEGVSHISADAAAREGHLHLRYVFLTTVQAPHREVAVRVDEEALAGGDLAWIVKNGTDVPIRGADQNGRFEVRVERREMVDGKARWRSADTRYICTRDSRVDKGQRLEPGASTPIEPVPYRRGRMTFGPGVHRIVFDYGLIPRHPVPRLDAPLPMVTVRTVHRREGWFRLGPEPAAPKP